MPAPDFIVVGAGVAGLRAAIGLASQGSVLVVTKQDITQSATHYAQGGIAVVLSDEDEVGLHLQDTIRAGDGIVNERAAHVLVEEGPGRLEELLSWGAEFDRDGSRLAFTREAAHSRSRVLHAHGDSTGREIGRTLAAKARTFPNIRFEEFEFSSELLRSGDRISGLQVIDRNGAMREIHAGAVLLATGGAGQVYADTTNPSVATGDGVAMALRAGAELADMEFVQFHPTALFLPGAPRFLLSEALRGEGAVLRNRRGERFLASHPLAELAPRDVVARAIAQEIAQSRSPQECVYLDMRHLGGQHFETRFPRIYATCLQFGVDITRDLVPVRPAAHYFMGGVHTDLDGRTSLPGLYAAGEAACTGVHGANRLASNSLLEGLVFGARTALAMSRSAGNSRLGLPDPALLPALPAIARMEIQALMSRCAGVIRNQPDLELALAQVQTAITKAGLPPQNRREYETLNIVATADCILRAALARAESRGAHYRTDFPEHDDPHYACHSLLRAGQVSFVSF